LAHSKIFNIKLSAKNNASGLYTASFYLVES
jgi:hypothetical protein